MSPAIFLSAAAGDVGVRSPWALVGGLVGVAAVAALGARLRPALLRRLGVSRAELSRPTRESRGADFERAQVPRPK